MGQDSKALSPHEVTWASLEREDWHLWILAVLLLLVFGVSLLSFMLPSVFWGPEGISLQGPEKRAFLGLAVLLALAMIHMVQRQSTVRRLKRQLFQALQEAIEREQRAIIEMFESLPGIGPFHDSLSMEFRRVSTSGSHLSMVLFDFPDAGREDSGRLARVLRTMLRRGEGMFRISDSGLAVILPNTTLNEAQTLTAETEAGMKQQCPNQTVKSIVTAYPEQVQTYSELEAVLRVRP